MDKDLADVDNKKLQKVVERPTNYNRVLNHGKGSNKKISDTLSRLCIKVCLDSYEFKAVTNKQKSSNKEQSTRDRGLSGDEDS